MVTFPATSLNNPALTSFMDLGGLGLDPNLMAGLSQSSGLAPGQINGRLQQLQAEFSVFQQGLGGIPQQPTPYGPNTMAMGYTNPQNPAFAAQAPQANTSVAPESVLNGSAPKTYLEQLDLNDGKLDGRANVYVLQGKNFKKADNVALSQLSETEAQKQVEWRVMYGLQGEGGKKKVNADFANKTQLENGDATLDQIDGQRDGMLNLTDAESGQVMSEADIERQFQTQMAQAQAALQQGAITQAEFQEAISGLKAEKEYLREALKVETKGKDGAKDGKLNLKGLKKKDKKKLYKKLKLYKEVKNPSIWRKIALVTGIAASFVVPFAGFGLLATAALSAGAGFLTGIGSGQSVLQALKTAGISAGTSFAAGAVGNKLFSVKAATDGAKTFSVFGKQLANSNVLLKGGQFGFNMARGQFQNMFTNAIGNVSNGQNPFAGLGESALSTAISGTALAGLNRAGVPTDKITNPKDQKKV